MENATLEDKRELISVRTLSTMIDTPPKTIRDWVYKGYLGIPFTKLGNQLRFNVKAIRKWLAAMEVARAQTAKHGRGR
jgi:hypothetical protein